MLTITSSHFYKWQSYLIFLIYYLFSFTRRKKKYSMLLLIHFVKNRSFNDIKKKSFTPSLCQQYSQKEMNKKTSEWEKNEYKNVNSFSGKKNRFKKNWRKKILYNKQTLNCFLPIHRYHFYFYSVLVFKKFSAREGEMHWLF